MTIIFVSLTTSPSWSKVDTVLRYHRKQ